MRRPSPRRLGILLLLVLVLLGEAAGVQAQERPTGRIGLGGQTPWVGATTAFGVRVDVDGLSRPDDVELHVSVHRSIRSRSEFQQTLEGRLLGQVLKEERWPLTDLPFDPGGALTVSLAPTGSGGPTALPSLRTGVYPVTVSIRDRRTRAAIDSFVTHLIRVPDDEVPDRLDVAWVHPVAAPPAFRPDGTVVLGQGAVDALTILSEAIGAHPRVPMTVDLSPETAEALVATGRSALLEPFRAGPERLQLLAPGYVRIAPSAFVEAGLDDRLAAQRQAGDDALLDAVGRRGDPRTWSAETPLTAAALNRLRAVGVTQVVVDEEDLAALDTRLTGGLTLARPFALSARGGAVVRAAAVDRGLSAHFTNSDEQVLAAHHLLADLAVLFLDAPGTRRGVVVRPPEGWIPRPTFLRTVLGPLATSRVLGPVTVDQLFEDIAPLQADGEVVVRSRRAEAEVGSLPADRLQTAQLAVDAFASMAPTAREERALLDRLLLVAEGRELSSRARDHYLDALTSRVDGARSGIRLLDGRTFRLTAREGTIPLTLVNDNPFDVEVDLRLSSEKLEFAHTDSDDKTQRVLPALEVPASGTLTITLPVRARASAAFSLRATLTAPDGGLEIGRSRFTIVSTVFSGVGVVLSAGAGLFLLVWWARHWRTARRDRRLVPARGDRHH